VCTHPWAIQDHGGFASLDPQMEMIEPGVWGEIYTWCEVLAFMGQCHERCVGG
jgi:hypothetical protein